MAAAVFIPFKITNSAEHVQSTAGGITAEIGDMTHRAMIQNNAPDDQLDELKPVIIRQGWGKVAPNNIICQDSPHRSTVLSSLGAGDTLYVRGHCTAGSSVLQSSDHTVNVDIPTIVGYLENELPYGFSGKVKVYACESGSSSGALWWKEASFATKLSNAMINKGWNACSYYGYTAELSTYVVNGHKRKRTDHTVRAKSLRVQVP